MVNENLPHKNTTTAVWLIQNNEDFVFSINSISQVAVHLSPKSGVQKHIFFYHHFLKKWNVWTLQISSPIALALYQKGVPNKVSAYAVENLT